MYIYINFNKIYLDSDRKFFILFLFFWRLTKACYQSVHANIHVTAPEHIYTIHIHIPIHKFTHRYVYSCALFSVNLAIMYHSPWNIINFPLKDINAVSTLPSILFIHAIPSFSVLRKSLSNIALTVKAI